MGLNVESCWTFDESIWGHSEELSKVLEQFMNFSEVLANEVGVAYDNPDLNHRVGGEVVLDMNDIRTLSSVLQASAIQDGL